MEAGTGLHLAACWLSSLPLISSLFTAPREDQLGQGNMEQSDMDPDRLEVSLLLSSINSHPRMICGAAIAILICLGLDCYRTWRRNDPFFVAQLAGLLAASLFVGWEIWYLLRVYSDNPLW